MFHFSHLRPTIFAADRVNQHALTRADGGGSVGMSLRPGAGYERDDQVLFLCLTQTRRTHRFALARHLQVQ